MVAATNTPAIKYRAFISYSHADTSWAKWLHRALEGFRIGKDLVGRETAQGAIPQTLRPIFRDRDDFTAGHALTDQTMAALDASHALVVLCSPRSAASSYVSEEIRLFKSRHPERPVVPLIVDGTPGGEKDECFAPALIFELDESGAITDKPIELLAADAREEGDGKNLALAKVVAGLLGLSSDDIFRRAERDRRRKQRNWISGLATVALMLAGLSIWAEVNRREAVAQRDRAEQTLDAATRTANGLVFDLAQRFRNVSGVPASLVKDLLDRARELQDELIGSGETRSDLRRSQGSALDEIARTLLSLGDTKAAL
ncbi:MAG: toll/interleukin-1 receptor domain-containing protein, partial [Pseudomonadota bacterium]